MIVLRPDRVEFDGEDWDGVVRVAIDRVSVRTIEGYDETGQYATLVDVARQRVVVRLTQEIDAEQLEMPIPGEQGELRLTGLSGSDVGTQRVSCACVVESVQNKISDYGATRTITLIAQSSSGDVDPVAVSSL